MHITALHASKPSEPASSVMDEEAHQLEPVEPAGSGSQRQQKLPQHHYRPPPIKQLARQSRFSERELRLLYRGFKQHCPSGLATEEHICSIFGLLFPFGNPAPFARIVFNWLDVDRRGELPFHRYVAWLSQLARGDLQERLGWIFRLYDVGQDGDLTSEEVRQFLLSVYELQGVGCSRRAKAPQEHAAEVFRRMDAGGKGRVDFEDFQRYCTESDAIVEGLEVFDTCL
ncbi:hypothetical protein BOX15_Mlig010605g1 [Macrostomum lignano]|uniref:EF-hand domain-containing protein n=1 Tax=Macrostomum lignano TaxID=282301 RepID=A0A267EBN1_9PLAT|nr:hypothetical protein BOX15_Mlig010605g1 [Macrostomum lignano]